ncbi:hypothetical protein [Nocardioides korecus]
MICCVAALVVVGLLTSAAEGVRRLLGRPDPAEAGTGFAPPARHPVDAGAVR